MHGPTDTPSLFTPESRTLQPPRESIINELQHREKSLAASPSPSPARLNITTRDYILFSLNVGQLCQVHVRSIGRAGNLRPLLRRGFCDLLLQLHRVRAKPQGSRGPRNSHYCYVPSYFSSSDLPEELAPSLLEAQDRGMMSTSTYGSTGRITVMIYFHFCLLQNVMYCVPFCPLILVAK